MMLGCEDDIFHPGFLGHGGPFLRIEKVRIKVVEVFLVVFVGEPLKVFDPFMPGGHRIESPMDEHPETGVRPPFHARQFLLPGLLGG